MTGQRHTALLSPHYAAVTEREQEPAWALDGQTLNFELRIAPFSLVSRSYSARAWRLTSQRTVLYDADQKTIRGQSLEAKGCMVERFEVALNTPVGRLTTAIDVPTGFIPLTAIVPVARRLGEEAAQLEIQHTTEAGQAISCRIGCAACCRMLVPLSAPEAFALRDYVEQLPTDQRTLLLNRLGDTKDRIKRAGLWDQLNDVSEASNPIADEELDPINRSYYALRMPCPYLENELCSIYEARPAACRELLVTSPAELCQDLVQNPVTPLPVSMRISSILGLAWGTLTNSPPRLIPLPIALEWAERHEEESRRTWPGSVLLDQVLDQMWRFLSQAFQNRSKDADS